LQRTGNSHFRYASMDSRQSLPSNASVGGGNDAKVIKENSLENHQFCAAGIEPETSTGAGNFKKCSR
jgi:hypothetical protein